jgi:hypothetical protein
MRGGSWKRDFTGCLIFGPVALSSWGNRLPGTHYECSSCGLALNFDSSSAPTGCDGVSPVGVYPAIMSLVSGPGFGGASTASKQTLHTEAHVKYIVSLDKRSDEYEYWLTEHLRLNGIYWGLIALHLLRHPTALPRDGLIDFVLKCWHPDSGGFGAAPGHDPHMLYTCSAIQVLAMVDALEVLEEPAVEGEPETKKSRIGNCNRLPLVET